MAGRPVQPAVCGAEDGLPSELSHSPSLSQTLTGRWAALPRASADGGPGWGVQVASPAVLAGWGDSWPRSHGGRGAGPWQRVLDDEGPSMHVDFPVGLVGGSDRVPGQGFGKE